MKEFPLKLIGVMLCAATLNSADGRTVAPQTKQVEEVHAAVTDMPDIIDMSNADPERGSVCHLLHRSRFWSMRRTS